MDKIIKRVFTKELQENNTLTVYDLFQWKKVDVHMKNWKTGKIIADMKDLEFPSEYSQTACNIIATKYFRKTGVNNKSGCESSMREVANRLVTFWIDALQEEGLVKDSKSYSILYDELVYSFLSQMWAPNSPQWFNTGLYNSYGIKGEKDELYYFDDKLGKAVESQDRYTRTQASACFIISIQDRLLGPHSITEQYVSETKLFKGGSGVGTNFSSIRALNEPLSNGGYSSGMMSFLQGLDKNAGAIKSGGTTRRAAKMVINDIDHPEIENFITWKAREERKVKDLGKMGYDISMEGEAYATVGGQNSNNSVRLNKEFMESVLRLDEEPDATIELKGRVNNSINKEMPVKYLWDLLNQSSWECADPGLQFDDLYNAWHTCPAGEDGVIGAKHNRINATNPCSEYAFLDDTACNLASINIFRFYDLKSKKVKLDEYVHLVGIIQLVLEASIFWGQFPTPDIARKSYLFRTTGLGLANTASLLLANGLPYDSDHSRNFVAALAGIMTGTSYYVSSLMAKEVDPFPKYELNKKHMLKVIRNHARVAGSLQDKYEELGYEPLAVDHTLLEDLNIGNISETLKESWNQALKNGELNGYRNAQVSVIAPTGTISLAMDCGATSVEPFYSNIVFKQLIGGGSLEIVNPVLKIALENLEYTEEEIEAIIGHILEKNEDGTMKNASVQGAPYLKKEHYKVFDTANTIRPQGHVLMVSAITPLISGSVSKTVNLPYNATVKDVEEINKLAWITGSKAIAIYRDGCKASQPLSSNNKDDKEKELEDYTYDELLEYSKNCIQEVPNRKRPGGMRLSRTHTAKIGDIELYITIGFYEDGNVAEVFVSTDKEGTVVKGLLASLSKSLSNMLQYNVPPKEISRLLRGQQFEPSGFVSRHPYIKYASSISDLLSKILDIELGDFSRCQIKPETFYHIKNRGDDEVTVTLDVEKALSSDELGGERIYGESCSSCGGNRMVKNGTCKVCLDCGTTTGCS